MKTFNDSKSQHLEELEALISSSLSEKELEDRLSDYHDNDIAEILEKLTPQERLRLYRILGVDRTAEIFAYLDDAGPYMEELSLEKAANVVSHMDSDDAVDVLEIWMSRERLRSSSVWIMRHQRMSSFCGHMTMMRSEAA